MIRHIHIIIIIVFYNLSIAVYAQIEAPEACDSEETSYLSTNSQDSVYFFSDIPDSTYFMPDTSTYSGYAIQWEEFIPGAGYQNPVNKLKMYFTPDTISKGFRLTLTTTSDTVIRRCWAFTDSFDAEILTKDEDGNLSSGAYTAICDTYGPIQVKVTQADLIYYDPYTLDTLHFDHLLKKEWIKEENVSEGKMTEKGKIFGNLKYILSNAYWKDMYYTFVLSDSCGNEVRDSVYVRSIRPKASFEFEYINLDDKEYYPDRDSAYYFFYAEKNFDGEISAPAKFMFVNKSENAHEYFWSFGDSTSMTTTKDTILKDYIYWGNYDVKLIARHQVEWWNQTCESDTTIESDGTNGVYLSTPTLNAPNFYSVNNNSYMGTWRFIDVTISEFEIAIYSRSGRRVHHFKGNIRDWNGWDGSIRNTNNKVSTGVYYYVVKDFIDIRNFNPTIENENIWQGGEGSDSNNQDGSNLPGQSSSSSNNQSVKSNSEYRGFIHVFNEN
jgi:hypothetical protein